MCPLGRCPRSPLPVGLAPTTHPCRWGPRLVASTLRLLFGYMISQTALVSSRKSYLDGGPKPGSGLWSLYRYISNLESRSRTLRLQPRRQVIAKRSPRRRRTRLCTGPCDGFTTKRSWFFFLIPATILRVWCLRVWRRESSGPSAPCTANRDSWRQLSAERARERHLDSLLYRNSENTAGSL